MDKPLVLGPGEGEAIRETFHIKAGRPEIVVTEARYAPGEQGPDPHIHRHHVDAFWILAGRLAFPLGPRGDELEAGAGSFVLVPPEVVHTFHNPGPEEARFLNFHAPGMGFDRYLRSGFRIPYDQHDPPADGGRSASEVILLAPGEGRPLTLGPIEACVKAGRQDAIGSLTVVEAVTAPGTVGPILHRHRKTVESFYLLDGTFRLHFDDRQIDATPGSYVLIPPGNNHTSSHPHVEPARILNVMAPAGLDQYLEEAAALSAESEGPPDPRVLAQIASRYDFVAA
jgi:mannose-6-phosphate isomerase-like protein (cupin superfamily)